MNRPRLIRWLRISASTVCLILCGMLIGLWVRSYWWFDKAHCPLWGERMLIINSMKGRLTAGALLDSSANTGVFPSGWGLHIYSANQVILPRNFTNPYFGFAWDRYGPNVKFPGWLPAVIAGTLAAVLGIRKPYQFSLRTMLIVTALVAGLLGLVMWL